MIQQSHSWAYTQTKFQQIHAPLCSPYVNSNAIHNSQDMEMTYTSIDKWMDKENVVHISSVYFSSVTQSCPHFATPWIAACQASLSITYSQGLLKLMSIASVMPSNHLIFCHPLSYLQSFPVSGYFPVSQFFTSGGQTLEFQLQHQSFQWIFRTDLL